MVVVVVVVIIVVVVVKLLSDMELVVLLLHEDNANVVMSAIRINFILLIFYFLQFLRLIRITFYKKILAYFRLKIKI